MKILGNLKELQFDSTFYVLVLSYDLTMNFTMFI